MPLAARSSVCRPFTNQSSTRSVNEPLAGIRTECTDSRALPILNMVFDGIIAMNAAAVAALPESSPGDLADKQATFVLTGLGTGELLFDSAAYGFYATSELEQLPARVRRLERENRHEIRKFYPD